MPVYSLERFAAGPIEYFGLAAFIIIIVGGLHPPAHATSESVGEASAELPPAGACVGTQGGKPSGRRSARGAPHGWSARAYASAR